VSVEKLLTFEWESCVLVDTAMPCISCCEHRGNVDGQVSSTPINVSDITYLVSYLFQSGPPPPCIDEADVDGSGSVNVSNLYFVDELFRGIPCIQPCP